MLTHQFTSIQEKKNSSLKFASTLSSILHWKIVGFGTQLSSPAKPIGSLLHLVMIISLLIAVSRAKKNHRLIFAIVLITTKVCFHTQ